MPSRIDNSSSVLMVAAEASSSLYGLRLLQECQRQKLGVHFWGVGSQDMEQAGFERLGKSEDMAVVGIQEVLAHYKDIKGVFNNLVAKAKKEKPQCAILLDYPDFNLRLAKELHKLNIPVIYYISPQLWAWRKNRIKQVQKYVSKMLVLFPFEVDFYKKNNVDVQFVGHPLLDEIHDGFFTAKYLKDQRERYGIKLEDKVLALMPGSRKSELKYHLQTELSTAKKLTQENPNLKVIILVAPTFSIEQFKEYMSGLKDTDFNYMLVKQDPFEMIHMADVALTASGTATLMVGLMLKPMVIIYKLNPITIKLFKWLVGKRIKNFAMINLILGQTVCEEYLQNDANPEALKKALEKLLFDKNNYYNIMNELKKVHTLLGNKGATQKVVEQLKRYL